MSEGAARAIGDRVPGHYGVAPATLTLREVAITTAWNLQGNPGDAAFLATARREFDVVLPLVPNTTRRNEGCLALWLGPRSWLLVAVDGSTDSMVRSTFAARRDALNDAGGALFDVSASRVAFMIEGPASASVMATQCPLDFHPRMFATAQCAQSLLGHVNALVYRPTAAPAFVVLVARSMAGDVWHGLCVSAAPHGYDVAHPAAFP